MNTWRSWPACTAFRLCESEQALLGYAAAFTYKYQALLRLFLPQHLHQPSNNLCSDTCSRCHKVPFAANMVSHNTAMSTSARATLKLSTLSAQLQRLLMESLAFKDAA